MKKLLPKTSKNSQGFTLVELLVVISVIAILSVIGLTVYSNTQKGARDARRRADIEAIAAALETNKTPNSTTYNSLTVNQFAGGIVPADTTTAKYSILSRTDGTIIAKPTAWPAASSNPTAIESAGTTVATVAVGVPATSPAPATNWKTCALLEIGSAIHCVDNQQ